jgi:hypothetical protein
VPQGGSCPTAATGSVAATTAASTAPAQWPPRDLMLIPRRSPLTKHARNVSTGEGSCRDRRMSVENRPHSRGKPGNRAPEKPNRRPSARRAIRRYLPQKKKCSGIQLGTLAAAAVLPIWGVVADKFDSPTDPLRQRSKIERREVAFTQGRGRPGRKPSPVSRARNRGRRAPATFCPAQSPAPPRRRWRPRDGPGSRCRRPVSVATLRA